MSKILFLSRWFPDPPDNGSKLRVLNLLQGIAGRHDVTLISFSDRQPADSTVLRDTCREIRVVPWKSAARGNAYSFGAWLSPVPRSMAEAHSAEMRMLLEGILRDRRYDLIIASQAGTAAYARDFGALPALFEEAEVGFLYDRFAAAASALRRLRYRLTWEKHRRYIGRLLRCFRACTVVSESEKSLLQKCAPHYTNVEVIPNCVSLSTYGSVRETMRPNTLIFTGSLRYRANHDAMIWFLGRVFPIIQAEVPEARLTITGDHADLPLPASGSVERTGIVNDVRPLIASSCISIVPLRMGGGTRLKILEAMALRTPVISTSKGAEGLGVEHDEHIMIEDTPHGFARAAVRLLTESRQRERLAENAYRLVSERFDWAAAMPRFLHILERIVRS